VQEITAQDSCPVCRRNVALNGRRALSVLGRTPHDVTPERNWRNRDMLRVRAAAASPLTEQRSRRRGMVERACASAEEAVGSRVAPARSGAVRLFSDVAAGSRRPHAAPLPRRLPRLKRCLQRGR